MKNHYLFIALLLLTLRAVAQELAPETKGLREDPEWLRMYQSKGFLSTSMDMDAEHYLYTGGTFRAYLGGRDSALASVNKNYRDVAPNNVFVQKHSLEGELLWTVYSEGQGRLHDLKVEPGGTVLITGEVWSPDLVFVSANGQRDSLAKAGAYDHGIYLARFSADGVLLQMEYFGTFKNDNANSIGLGPDGTIVLAGNYMHNNDGDLERNWLLMALNQDFSVKWLRAGDSIGRSALMDVVVDRKGRITVAGWYTNRVKVGNELRQNEWSNQMEWLAQFEEDGTLCWFNDNIYGVDPPYRSLVIKDLSLDSWGRILITGGNQPFFICGRLKRNGSIDWLRESSGRSSYSFGMHRKSDGAFITYGHGYGSTFKGTKGDSISYQTKGSTDFLCLEYSRKGALGKMIVGGGLATDYLTAVFWHEGKLYALGHDLGGPAIEFGDQSLPKGDPKMWLACWDWP